MNKKNKAGFTIFELIVVIAIIMLIGAIAVPNFVSFKKSSDLNNNVQEFENVLETAQNKAISSDSGSQYGVYINTTSSPNQYTLFKGESFDLRDPSADQNYFLQDSMEFYGINLGGGSEIIFERLTGATAQTGNITIRFKLDTVANKTIYITSSGTVSFSPPADLLDVSRIQDTRHMHFVYNRAIDTANESITLTFGGGETKNIKISSYLVEGEIQWSGVVSIGDSEQILEINTHKLNNPDTIFSVHRDRRYNNKSLLITISGDSSGGLIQYLANGEQINGTSIYVSDFGKQ